MNQNSQIKNVSKLNDADRRTLLAYTSELIEAVQKPTLETTVTKSIHKLK